MDDNILTFAALGFLAGVILTFASCSPNEQPQMYEQPVSKVSP